MKVHEHTGNCHCGAIAVELQTTRPPQEQVIGACQCSFCRKHNARTFSDPGSKVRLTAREPDLVQHYSFGLETARSVLCSRCGVYVAMVLSDAGETWCTLNIDTLDDRALFVKEPGARDYSVETAPERLARRKSRWCPTVLENWPA